MQSVLEALFVHNRWANLELFDVCAGLSAEQQETAAPGTFGSIASTLVHVAANEEGYLLAMGKEPGATPIFAMGEPPPLEQCRERLERTGELLIEAAREADLESMIEVEWQGKPISLRAYVPLLQAINHGTEHRGQIAASLTVAGVEPPEIDMWSGMHAGVIG